jgi:hypothetical protein
MMTINCGCEKCCAKTEWGGLAPHRIKITKNRNGQFIARGHAIDGYEIIEGAHTWDDIIAMYDNTSWQLQRG